MLDHHCTYSIVCGLSIQIDRTAFSVHAIVIQYAIKPIWRAQRNGIKSDMGYRCAPQHERLWIDRGVFFLMRTT